MKKSSSIPYLILSSVAVSCLLSCSKEIRESVSDGGSEGIESITKLISRFNLRWACPPGQNPSWENLSSQMDCEESKRDYLYFNIYATVSPGAIGSGSFVEKMKSCRASADYSMSEMGNTERMKKRRLGGGIIRAFSQYYELNGTTNQTPGFSFVEANAEKLGGHDVYDCCPAVLESPLSGLKCGNPDQAGEWDSCICLAYVRYEGGEKAIRQWLIDNDW